MGRVYFYDGAACPRCVGKLHLHSGVDSVTNKPRQLYLCSRNGDHAFIVTPDEPKPKRKTKPRPVKTRVLGPEHQREEFK